MRKITFLLIGLMTVSCPMLNAAPQVVTGAAVAIDADGVADGLDFQNQGVTASTLTAGTGANVNDNGNAIGAQTNVPGASIISFNGGTGTNIINGTVGVGLNTFLDINGGLGSSIQIFNGTVGTATFSLLGNGTMQFNGTTSGALNFGADGTLVIGSGATFTGALTTSANNGTLTLNNASTLIGAVGVNVAPLKQINVLAGNATINGATSATNFSLASNTLTNTGALALPVNTVINTTVISDTTFGNINLGAADDQISAPVVTVNVDASQALLSGAPLFVVNAGSGTSNVPITVTSNNIRYSFIGNNLNGDITIIPTLITGTLVTNPNDSAVGTVLDNLVPIAAANPGSDLAFVQLQLSALPTVAALQDALNQIAPGNGLVGVGRETFNTTKQFQKVWLEHLHRNRQYCLFQDPCCSPCNDPCYDPCGSPCGQYSEGPMVWADGFGYYGRQENTDFLNGYNAHTWGTVWGVEMPVFCGIRAGIAGGYAHTDLDERLYGNETDIQNCEGTLYFSYNPNNWFLDVGFSLGWSRYDGERNIVFPGIDRTAKARYNGNEYSVFAATGYQYQWNCLVLTPLATVLYSHLHLDRYTETGADSLNLTIRAQDYDYLETGLGVKIEGLYKTCYGILIPEVHAIWLHDYEDDGLDVTASFVGIGAAGGTFNNLGPRFDPDTLNVGVGLTCLTSPNFSILFLYDYETSHTYYDHQGTVAAAYRF